MESILKGDLDLKVKENLLEGNIGRVFLSYLLPSVGGMLGISLYVLGDTLLVGRGLGSNGLTALNLSIPIMNIFSGFGLLFGVGGATVLSILKGQGRDEEANNIFTISFLFSFITGLLITIFGLIYLEKFCIFMGASKGIILNMSKEYLTPLFLSSIFFVTNSLMIVFVRNDNSPRLSMIAMLASSISNVILDYVFLFIFDWGIRGIGIATALSPIISLFILSTHFIRGKNTIGFEMIKPSVTILKRITSNGVPSFVIESMAGIVIFVFNRVILGIEGDLGVAAYSIVANLSLFCAAVFNGIGQGIQPIISINYGAERYERVYEIVRLAVYTSVGVGVSFFLMGLIFPKQLASIFIKGTNENLMNMSITGIRLYFISFILMGLNTVLISFLQSKEYARESISISIGRGFVFILIGIIMLPKLFGIEGVWITIPVAEMATLLYSLIVHELCRDAIGYSIGVVEM